MEGGAPAKGQAADPAAHGEESDHGIFTYLICRVTRSALLAQIPWGNQFDHETARELFGSNLLALTWIKGDPMPGELVDEILRGLGLERETDEQRRRRTETRTRTRERGQQSGVRSSLSSGLGQLTDEQGGDCRISED